MFGSQRIDRILEANREIEREMARSIIGGSRMNERQIFLTEIQIGTDHTKPVMVNWRNVTHVSQSEFGSFVHLVHGGYIEVQETLKEIAPKLNGG